MSAAQVRTERFEMRLDPAILDKLDSWRSNQDDVPSRSEAVRRLVEAGLAAKGADRRITLSDGEKLLIIMLGEMFKQLKLKGDVDPAFLEEVIYGGHYWALGWGYSGLFHGHEDSDSVVSEVVDILDMWSFLERGFNALSKKDKERVVAEAEPFGEYVNFTGFDGNGEAEYNGVARVLINQLGRFTDFKGRELNSHMPSLDMHNRMLLVFEPLRKNLIGRDLNAEEIIQILQAKLHPSKRKM